MAALRSAMVSVILDRWHHYHHNTITESQYYSKAMCCDRSYDVGVINGVLLTPYELEHSTQSWQYSDYLCPLPTVQWCQELIDHYRNNSRVSVNLDTGIVTKSDSFVYYSLWEPLTMAVKQYLATVNVLQDSFITHLRKDRVATHKPSSLPPPQNAPLLSDSLYFNLVGHHNALSMHDFQHIQSLLE